MAKFYQQGDVVKITPGGLRRTPYKAHDMFYVMASNARESRLKHPDGDEFWIFNKHLYCDDKCHAVMNWKKFPKKELVG